MSGRAGRASRLLRRPPRYLARRLTQEIRRELDRGFLVVARRDRGPVGLATLSPDPSALASTRVNVTGMGAWAEAAGHIAGEPLLKRRVLERAERAAHGEVEAFGDAPLVLSRPFPWRSDPRAGY